MFTLIQFHQKNIQNNYFIQWVMKKSCFFGELIKYLNYPAHNWTFEVRKVKHYLHWEIMCPKGLKQQTVFRHLYGIHFHYPCILLDKHECVNDSSNHSKTDYFQSGSGKFCNYYVNIHSVYLAILHDHKQSPMPHIYYLWKKNEQKNFKTLKINDQ